MRSPPQYISESKIKISINVVRRSLQESSTLLSEISPRTLIPLSFHTGGQNGTDPKWRKWLWKIGLFKCHFWIVLETLSVLRHTDRRKVMIGRSFLFLWFWLASMPVIWLASQCSTSWLLVRGQPVVQWNIRDWSYNGAAAFQSTFQAASSSRSVANTLCSSPTLLGLETQLLHYCLWVVGALYARRGYQLSVAGLWTFPVSQMQTFVPLHSSTIDIFFSASVSGNSSLCKNNYRQKCNAYSKQTADEHTSALKHNQNWHSGATEVLSYKSQEYSS